MGTRALLAITVGDSFLATRVSFDGGFDLASKLNSFYGTRELAANLISLGSMMSVGETIDQCILVSSDVHEEARFCVDQKDLERYQLANEHHVHVFDEQGWNHWIDDEVDEEIERRLSGE